MHNPALRKLMAYLATGVMVMAINGPFPFSANAVASNNAQANDKAKKDKKSEESKNQGVSKGNFESFYARFRSVINRRDQAGLREVMSPQFEWALDGYTTREQAFKNIGQIIGWQKFWQSAALAVAEPPQACKPHHCNNRSGYETFTKSPFPLEMMFELGSDNQWHWSAVLGD